LRTLFADFHKKSLKKNNVLNRSKLEIEIFEKPGPVPGFDLLTWACSPEKAQAHENPEGQKMPGPAGLWVQEKPRPWSRPSSISNPNLLKNSILMLKKSSF